MKLLSFLLLTLVFHYSCTMQIAQLITKENDCPHDFLEGSTLIAKNHKEMLYEWISYHEAKTNLLWRASQHNFDWKNMHDHCDNRGSALVIIKTKQGYLFGGFASEGIKAATQGYQKDRDAFIFSLTRGTAHRQRNKTLNCILHSSEYISFGGRYEGHWDDISLKNSCNVDYWSYSDFGWSYLPPDGVTPGTTQAQTYMAGTYRWMCADVEIWAVHREF